MESRKAVRGLAWSPQSQIQGGHMRLDPIFPENVIATFIGALRSQRQNVDFLKSFARYISVALVISLMYATEASTTMLLALVPLHQPIHPIVSNEKIKEPRRILVSNVVS
jgi:hypothetical protein